MVGRVILIGAGPGDPGLITVRGARLLADANVVLYDGLANPELLSHAPVTALKICVGKHGHGGSWSQSQIDDETIRYARLGNVVVRLKGGDTSIFARTAEEVDRLIEEKIPFEIVPGITAALAAGAYAGIPITHRDWSSAVALVTGQLQPADGSLEADETLDWEALAKFPGTLVLYMGASSARHWSMRLIESGRAPSTPVAMIRRCSYPDQQVLRCELSSVSETLAQNTAFKPPIISIVGDVVRLAKPMDWFRDRPWFGKAIWIPSPLETGSKLATMFVREGACVVNEPIMRIASPLDWNSVDSSLQTIDQYDWIVFSSVFGVEAFFHRLSHLGKDCRCLHANKIAAVGTGTAHALQRQGIVCDMVPQVQGSASLAELLMPIAKNSSFLFVRNPNGETKAMEMLSQAGARVSTLDVYRQIMVKQLPVTIASALKESSIDHIAVTSSNLAQQALELTGDYRHQVTWLCLSEKISRVISSAGCERVLTAREASFESLVDLAPR
jgi:uroporphyrinogen III methyltransferase / synthase